MKLFSTILLMAIMPFCFSQSSGSYEFVGFLTTTDRQVINFKLIISEIKKGAFKGYSITNYNGADYTKSVIEGKVDLKEKKMSFKEIRNTETKSKAEESTFCYITASDLTIIISGKKNIVKGKFIGVFPSGQTCASGAVFLVNNDVLEDTEVSEKKIKQDVPEPQKVEIKDSIIEPQKIEVKDAIIADSVFTSNEVLSITQWKAGVALEVWDGNVEDGDEIAIYVNDVLKKAKVVLTHKRNIIYLPSNGEKFTLKIVALNEGRTGKNTLNFKLINADTDKDYIAELNKGESFIIDFNKGGQ